MAARSATVVTAAEDWVASPSEQFSELRAVLFKDSDQRISALEESLAQTISDLRSRERLLTDSSSVLAEAVELRQRQDESLAEALQPVLVDGFHRSIRDDPNVLAESLYPVLGPAVRKLVANLFTPDRANPGKPYSIEHFFVIHRETSLLINQTLIAATESQDGDMISGMLDAIRSFVREAFDANEFDGLDTLTVGDLTVWVEWGPKAIMAVVLRGVAPPALRQNFARGLEFIHLNYAEQLRDFDGDNSAFGGMTTELKTMVEGTRRIEIAAQVAQWRTPVLAIAVSALLLASTGYWLYISMEWRALVDELNAQPGIVVVKAEHSFGRHQISGLRDPFAADPALILANIDSSIDRNNITTQWHAYQSLDDEIVLARARKLLATPVSVQLEVSGEKLVVSGVASSKWTAEAAAKWSVVKSVLNKDLILELTVE